MSVLSSGGFETTERKWPIGSCTYSGLGTQKQSGSGVDLSLVLEINEDPGVDEIAQGRSGAGGIEGEQKVTLAQASQIFI